MSLPLRYSLHAQSSYVRGEPVIMAFSIESFSSHDTWILKWYTPLEGIKGRIFDVRCDGVEIPYQGRMVKRGQPKMDDYILLKPGASVHAEFDLSQVYPLTECKECWLKFKGRLHDAVFDRQLVPQAVADHISVDVPGNSVSFLIDSQKSRSDPH